MSDADLVGFDLCALGTSDHSIFTYGTFGMWGSLLAGGDVIAAKSHILKYHTSEDDSTVDPLELIGEQDYFHLQAALPQWRYIDTRNVENITILKVDPETHKFIIE